MWPFKRKPILAGVRGMNVRAVLRVVWLLALTSSGNAAEIVAAPLNSNVGITFMTYFKVALNEELYEFERALRQHLSELLGETRR